jgi:alpha-D-ribose 1-methylphosphonate 5-phosphate C-P lyase
VPIPEPLAKLEPREAETKVMHGLAEYGLMHVKLYEDIARHGHIATTYDYPVLVDGRFLMSPSPIPKFDNPKMHRNPALQLFGAGREKRIYAIPPHTTVESLAFEDHPFEIQKWDHACALCGSRESFLDEVITDDQGGRMFICSDTDYCGERRAQLSEGSSTTAAAEIPPAPLLQRGVNPTQSAGATDTNTPPFEKGGLGGISVAASAIEQTDGASQ